MSINEIILFVLVSVSLAGTAWCCKAISDLAGSVLYLIRTRRPDEEYAQQFEEKSVAESRRK